MSTLSDLFDAVDNDVTARETADLNDLQNETFDFSPDIAELNGMYFIPEGDERAFDKMNYNFKVMADSSGNNYTETHLAITAKNKDFIFADTTKAIAQQDKIDSIVVVNNFNYTTTVNGSVATANPARAQKNRISGIVAAGSITYSFKIDSNTVSYTSPADTAQVDTFNNIIYADSTAYGLTINGTAFAYTTGTGETKLTIVSNLVSSINTGSEPVTATDNSDGTFYVTADVAGTAFTSIVTAGGFNVLATTANATVALSTIVSSLKTSTDAVSGVSAIINGNDIDITSDIPGVPFTITTLSHVTDTTITTNITSSTTNIISTLVANINALGKPVTVTSDASSIVIKANPAGVSFTLSTSTNLSNSNIIANYDGVVIVTLPENPADFERVIVFDYKGNFGNTKTVLTSVNDIMGSSNNMNLIVSNSKTELISYNNDWRII